MNIIILGPQGSGKGTQAKLLAQKFELFYFEAGEFLREIAQKNKNVKAILDSGKIVPGDEMASYVKSFFDEKQIYDDIIFDGFPRTLSQYKFIKNWMNEKKIKFDLCLILDVRKEISIKRLLFRKREDDTPEAIKKRLALYESETLPLIMDLEKEIKVIHVDGERRVEIIQKDLERIINDKVND